MDRINLRRVRPFSMTFCEAESDLSLPHAPRNNEQVSSDATPLAKYLTFDSESQKIILPNNVHHYEVASALYLLTFYRSQ